MHDPEGAKAKDLLVPQTDGRMDRQPGEWSGQRWNNQPSSSLYDQSVGEKAINGQGGGCGRRLKASLSLSPRHLPNPAGISPSLMNDLTCYPTCGGGGGGNG